jgi:DNA-binding transcriptional ArsR family regulator
VTSSGNGGNMKFIKAPGDIYDLFKIFAYHFNKEQYIEKYQIEDPIEYDKMMNDVSDGSEISDKLFMFFYIGEKNSFMEEKFLDADKYDFHQEDYFGNICEKIKTTDLFSEVLRFYTEYKGANEILSADYLYEILTKYDLPDKIRLQLMHFNYNRSVYTEILLKEITEKYEWIMRLYCNKQKEVEQINEMLQDESVQTKLFNLLSFYPPADEAVLFSVSLMQDKLLTVLHGQKTCLLIGCEVLRNFDEMNNIINNVNIDVISKALSENIRIDLLNFIKSKGEITTTEIANTFGKGLTATYYHLNILAEAHALKYRNEGRAVYYSINSEFFGRYADLIRKFGSDKGTML